MLGAILSLPPITMTSPPTASRPTWLATAALLALAGLPAQADPSAPLQTVVVSATRHAMSQVDAPAAMSVVSADDIAQRGADNLLEALRGETGVAVFGRTIAGRKALALRGMDPRHTLFLVDGRRISASDGVIGHSDFQLDWVAMDQIDRIEVVRGPLSVLYGAEALGGVVQVFTRPLAAQFEGRAALEGTQTASDRGGEGHRVSATVSGPLGERLRAGLSVSDSRRQAVASALDPRLSDLEGRHKQEASWRLRWAPAGGHALELEQRWGQEERWADSIERSGRRRLFQSVTDLDRNHAALTWSADWGGQGDWRSTVRAYESRLAMRNQRNNGVAALRPNRLTDRVAEVQFSGQPRAGHLLSAGAELRQESLRNEGLPGGSAEAEHRSLLLQDEISLSRALTVTAGLRHDAHQRFGSEWSPRLYAVWRLAPQWVLKGGYSHGFKAPTLKQITPGYQEDEGPYTYLSNPSLRAETNRGAELGLAYDTARAGVQFMLFDNRVAHLIVPQQVTATGPRITYRYENIERARLRGAEWSGRMHLAGGWTASASYQYLEAQDGHGARLEKRPRHTLGGALDWATGPWRAGLRIDSTAGQLMAPAVVGQPLQAAPPLSFVGASVSRDLPAGLNLGLGVNNLSGTNPPERSALYSWGEAPRTWRLALRSRW